MVLSSLFPKPKIGLALGGGGPKGLSHIGVIKILEKYGIPIDYVAGTSIGALVGGLYCATKNIRMVEQLALDTNWPQVFSLFFDPSLRQGLIKGDKIEKFIADNIGDTSFMNLLIPFAALATDAKSGDRVTVHTGSVSSAIRASISVPLVFNPVEQNSKLLVDGGLSTPVPVDTVRDMGADIVIAVNLYEEMSISKRPDTWGLYEIANQSLDIMLHHLAKEHCKSADITIEPKVGDIGWKSLFTKQASREVIISGENITLLHIGKIKNLMRKKTFQGFIRRFMKLFNKGSNPSR